MLRRICDRSLAVIVKTMRKNSIRIMKDELTRMRMLLVADWGDGRVIYVFSGWLAGWLASWYDY